MRRLDSIVRNVVQTTAAKMDTAALIKKHRAAADYHNAIAEAMEAQVEIDDAMRERRAPDAYWIGRYREEVGKAGVALLGMPIKWAAVLETEMHTALTPVLKAAE